MDRACPYFGVGAWPTTVASALRVHRVNVTRARRFAFTARQRFRPRRARNNLQLSDRMIDLGQRMHEVKALGRLHANSGDMLAALAVAGTGVTLEPDFIVADDVRAGRLVPLLEDYAAPSITIHAAYPSRRHLSAKVRTFIDFLVQRFSRDPPWQLPAPAARPAARGQRAGRRAAPAGHA